MTFSILAITIPFFLVGAGLMAVASRNAPPGERRRRWLKFCIYVLIVHIVLGSASLGGLYLTSLVSLILLFGTVEFCRALSLIDLPFGHNLLLLILYALLAIAFALTTVSLPPRLVVFLYLVVAGFDGFSEALGRLLGRMKLAAKVSPGKTVEGALGGLVGALALAACAHRLAELTLLVSLALAAVIALSSLAGDLAASWVKRRAGIKDFGSLIPEHGGVLDRFDSFVASGALSGALLKAISP
jgi:phosphatidate cytidylyltransferase